MNQVFLAGYAGNKAEAAVTKNGTAVTRFRIGVKQWNGAEKRAETMFVDCNVFGNSAAYCLKNIDKGTFIALRGRLIVNKVQSATGEYKSYVTVICDEVQCSNNGQGPMIDDRSNVAYATEPTAQKSYTDQAREDNATFPSLPDDDDGDGLPF